MSQVTLAQGAGFSRAVAQDLVGMRKVVSGFAETLSTEIRGVDEMQRGQANAIPSDEACRYIRTAPLSSTNGSLQATGFAAFRIPTKA